MKLTGYVYNVETRSVVAEIRGYTREIEEYVMENYDADIFRMTFSPAFWSVDGLINSRDRDIIDLGESEAPNVQSKKVRRRKMEKAVYLKSDEKVKLILWMNENKGIMHHTSEDLARRAAEALGFTVPSSSILTYRKTVAPDITRPASPWATRISKLEERIKALEAALPAVRTVETEEAEKC